MFRWSPRLRQSELEPFGFPWRLIYLGDPLYRVGRGSRENSSLTVAAKEGRIEEPRADRRLTGIGGGAGPAHRTRPSKQADGRIDASQWAKAAAAHELLPARADRRDRMRRRIRRSRMHEERLRRGEASTVPRRSDRRGRVAEPDQQAGCGSQPTGRRRVPSQRHTDWRTVLATGSARETGGGAAACL